MAMFSWDSLCYVIRKYLLYYINKSYNRKKKSGFENKKVVRFAFVLTYFLCSEHVRILVLISSNFSITNNRKTIEVYS